VKLWKRCKRVERRVGAASIIDRSGGKAEVGVPRVSLASLDVPSVEPSVCDACARGDYLLNPEAGKNSRR